MQRVEVRGISYSVNGEEVLRDISLTITGPGLVQLIGPNGAGKTTLLRVLAGLLKPSRGRVFIDGVDVTGNPRIAGRYIGYVPQRPPLTRFNPMTVWEFVSSRLLFMKPWPRAIIGKGGGIDVIENVLNIVGLPRDTWEKKLQELSGGQLMRAFIARTLVHNPEILLLDEPLSPVDPAGRIGIVNLLARLSGDRLVLVTSHDPILLLEHTKTLVLLNRVVVAEGPPDSVLRRDLLERVYGRTIVEVERHFHIFDYHVG